MDRVRRTPFISPLVYRPVLLLELIAPPFFTPSSRTQLLSASTLSESQRSSTRCTFSTPEGFTTRTRSLRSDSSREDYALFLLGCGSVSSLSQLRNHGLRGSKDASVLLLIVQFADQFPFVFLLQSLRGTPLPLPPSRLTEASTFLFR